MEETIIPACDVFRPEITIKTSPVELCWNFTTFKKNIKFGVYRSLDNENSLENSKNVTISYNALNEKGLTQNEKSEIGSTSMLANETMSNSQIDISPNNSSSSSYNRRRSNFNDYNLEVVKKLEYCDSSKSIIKGSCVLNKVGTYVLVFDNSINRNSSNRLTFLYFTRAFNLLPEISNEEDIKDNDNKSEILFEGYISKKKRNNKINSWVKRYVTLDKAGNLSYYKNKESTSKGLIQINSSKVNIVSKRRIYIDTGAFIYRFYIREDNVYKKFLDALELIEKRNSKSEVMSTIRNIIYNDESLKGVTPDNNALEEVQKDFEEPLNQIHKELNNLGLLIDKYKKDKNIEDVETCYENLMKSISSVDFGLNRIWKRINEEEICVAKLEKTFRNCLTDNNRLRAIVNEPQVDISFFTDYKPEEIINDQTQNYDAVDKAMTASTKDDDSFYDAEDGFSLSGEDEINSTSDVVDADDTSDDSEESSTKVQDLNNKINEYDVVIKRTTTSTNIKESEKPIERRTALPAKTVPNAGSFISIIRKNIGKDLSRVSMPVTFNEPINLLQKLCEELEYSELLKNACDETLSPTEYDRLMYVGAFAFSAYAGTIHRAVKKPFNPLLGETYENIREDKGFRFISEKVSHHPPIMACYAESDDFIFFQDNNIKTKYWGNSMECINNGIVHLILKKYNEHYTWEKVNSVICKAMYANRYLEYRGELKVTEANSGNYFSLKFQSSKNGVSGGVYTSKKKEMIQLVGNWDKVLFKVEPENKLESIWSANAFPPNYEDQYGFGQFTIELNEITPDIKDKLPPTDTRFRPDQRLYEEGKADEASNEKERLEQRQREYLKEREQNGIPWEPRWFEYKDDPIVRGVKTYQYKGGYFEERGNITVEHTLW
ncbi:Oxysterol-binding protein-domain-containing protein [Neocallimastix lanati (nom. inval.)]|jgi:hypothetical protein|nr:Oxysterol-binding protein-domain-containing protein [Neocallimastix sp. JGI-2020a]